METRVPVIIPEDPPQNEYRVTLQFPGREPVEYTVNAANKAEVIAAVDLFVEYGATVLKL